MAASIKRAKTETVTLRLDPKTRFMLEFMSRVQARSITAVVEQAIREAAANVSVRSNSDDERTWSHFWDASEGSRTLQLISDANYPTNYEEDELLAFAHAHWEFFYISDSFKTPRKSYVDTLWPKIDDYLALWRDQRQADYWAAGRAMSRDLAAARLAGPEWPRGTKAIDLDDEIPF